MQLSRSVLQQIHNNETVKPDDRVFQLPEKIIQFGTGVLLRGLCDYFVDQSNRHNRFNGRIVVVKSTSAGGTDAFNQQDNLYTICVRGMDEGKTVKENIICSSVSRVINATTEWNKVLEAVEDPQIRIIISNTTEVGLQLVKESIKQQPPSSFPAKLLALLYSRYRKFERSEEGRMVVIPTELITENGDKLHRIIEELATFNELEGDFKKWLNTHVYFCNSLVDRIVTKDPGEKMINDLQEELGYKDELLTMCEDYRLWAIQGDDFVESVLSFAHAGEGVFVKPDIEIYKSLKLHLLNGTHTLSASLAFLSGFNTVKEAMSDKVFRDFVEHLMLEEIASAIPYPISVEEKNSFGKKVLDRFSNPFLQHQWLNITLQNTMKMKMRNMPVLLEYQRRHSAAPERMSTGFAAYILFMKAVKIENGIYYGNRNGEFYRINDDQAAFFYDLWKKESDPARITDRVLSNTAFWDADLTAYLEFRNEVVEKLTNMVNNSVIDTLNRRSKLS